MKHLLRACNLLLVISLFFLSYNIYDDVSETDD